MDPKLSQVENSGRIRRSQSLNSMHEESAIDLTVYKPAAVHRTLSDSSVELCVHSDGDERPMDSGICEKMIDTDMLGVMEQKIDRLSDMFLEQCKLLTNMKEELRSSKMMLAKAEIAHSEMLVGMLKKAIAQRMSQQGATQSSREDDSMNSRARTLLQAIESRQEVSLGSEIRNSVISFLQSEELKDQMVRATVESMRGLIGDCLSRDMSKLYLPVLERSHRRLIAHIHKIVEQAFFELEDKSSSLFRSVYKTSGALRRALEHHQCLLEASANPGKNLVNTVQCTVEELLQKELKEWRSKVTDLFSAQPFPISQVKVESPVPPLDYGPDTPPQPAGPEVSVIDQLMQTALINKQIAEGDVNGSFERALSAGDLSLVMAACRAVDPGQVFAAPCSLQQHVLLSLVQQLATDMLHETQLKCRYLEEAMINLDVSNQDTREHLPLVVEEVRKHLSKFLRAYPNHVAGRRIALIVMAANSLLK
ncbi:hypothetical protein PYW07_000736 [Mythimna separata]|uniref:Enhancer of mRNA-decapping protein 4 C-terminal domain-containing protein n=1 Tax=Mythimna separata TaxID=271217 RepID=A0AAD8DV92_MYTSE|nr:hypothetical protein PYW07_000736 [Mythimna separata]